MQRRILVASLARVLRDNLVIEGFQVRCVCDGNLAIRAARDFAPDLVLLDIALPGKNGFELCAGWRQSKRFPIIGDGYCLASESANRLSATEPAAVDDKQVAMDVSGRG